ncbi:MAG: hypothetical protein ACLFT0_20065 [Spirulinaceae cyanobacterium]
MLLTFVELMIILGWGLILKTIIKQKFNNISTCQLFKRSDYEPHSNYETPKYPQYSLVLVEFNTNRTIKSETFYTNLGDWIYFEYENNRKERSGGLMISSWLLVAFCIPGLLMILAFNILNLTQFFTNIDQTFLRHFLKISRVSCGISFWSSSIALLIKPSFEN